MILDWWLVSTGPVILDWCCLVVNVLVKAAVLVVLVETVREHVLHRDGLWRCVRAECLLNHCKSFQNLLLVLFGSHKTMFKSLHRHFKQEGICKSNYIVTIL